MENYETDAVQVKVISYVHYGVIKLATIVTVSKTISPHHYYLCIFLFTRIVFLI